MSGAKASAQLSLNQEQSFGVRVGGRASQDVSARPEMPQCSMRSQKTEPERDKAILIDAFLVEEVQVHTG